MNIDKIFIGFGDLGCDTEVPFIESLNKMLKEIEEIEDTVDGFEDPFIEECWDEAIRELLKEEKAVTVPNKTPEIKDVIYSGPATIIQWDDGTKTVVKCELDEEYNQEKGFVMAYMKKLLGDKKFFKELKKWVWKKPMANFDQKNKERKKAQGKKVKIETPAGLHGEDFIQKVIYEAEKMMKETMSVGESNKAVNEPIGDVSKVTPITCECGAEYDISSNLEYTTCPECGVLTKVEEGENEVQ